MFHNWLDRWDEGRAQRGEEAKKITCPSSNNLRLLGLWKNGVSGSVCGLI